jgi:hypothetical protein
VQRPALFGDEHMHTFFRRLAWSPDGVLLTPGHIDDMSIALLVSPSCIDDWTVRVNDYFVLLGTGSLLAVPTGVYTRSSSSSAPGYTTYVYARGHWEAPVGFRPAQASGRP